MITPRLRFPEFHEGWATGRVGDIADLLAGYAFDGDKFADAGNKLVTPKNFTKFGHGSFNAENSKFTSEGTESRFVCRSGDLLVLMTDLAQTCELLGKPLLLTQEDGEVFLNQRVIKIQPSKILSKGFLVNFLLTNQYHKRVKELATGSTVKHLSSNNIKSININFPSLSEQEKIGTFLAKIDEKIFALAREFELLKQYKKGIVEQIFTQKIRLKDINGGDFPVWADATLGDVSKKRSSNISMLTVKDSTGDYTLYGASGVIKGIDFYKEENPYISIVKDGAGVGRAFLCEAKSSVLGTMEMVIPNKNIDIRFLFEVINRIDFRGYITGSTIPHVYFKDYSAEALRLPSLNEQKKIADLFASIDMKISNVRTKLELSRKLKQGLLQQMFA